MIRPSTFAQVVYHARRFGEMLSWYRTVFGAKVQFQNPALAFLTWDDKHHRFAFADPDGNEMKFRVYCFETSEATKAYMDSHFEANPVGVEYDPDEWLERMRAGTPEGELLERRVREPVSPIRGALVNWQYFRTGRTRPGRISDERSDN